MPRSSLVSHGSGLAMRLVLTDGAVVNVPLPIGTNRHDAEEQLRQAEERIEAEGISSATGVKAARRGRPRKGSLVFRSGSWHVRVTMTVEGESIRKWLSLDTDDRDLAERKVLEIRSKDHGSLSAATELARRGETYRQVAERAAEVRRADVADALNEEGRERHWILPVIGGRPITTIRPKHIAQVYDRAKEAGKSQSHLRHLRTILRNRFALAVSDELIPSSPVDGVKLPKVAEDRRERSVLTDEELGIYLAWKHPEERWQPAVRERQTMSAIARMFGGLRTGDLHALDWSHFDAADDGFTRGTAPRLKTARPQRIAIPRALRPIVLSWWEGQGKPLAGPVFPSQRGPNQGNAKIKHSHAEAFRRDLQAAFEADPKAPQKGSSRWEELFEETAFTRPVDFHSWRRAFVQALAFAGINAQTAQKLAGHSDLAAHERYLRSSTGTLEIPESALPCAKTLPKMPRLDRGPKSKNPAVTLGSLVGVERFERSASGTQSQPNTGFCEVFGGSGGSEPSHTPPKVSRGYEPWTEFVAKNPEAGRRMAEAQLLACLEALVDCCVDVAAGRGAS